MGHAPFHRHLCARLVLGGISVCAAAAVCLAPLGVRAAGAATPTPPTQPTSGPGGKAHSWGSETITYYTATADGDDSYWIYTPSDWLGSGPAPTTAPLVVFLHGFGAYTPAAYYPAWLSHLTAQGDIVIFPKYQNTIFTFPTKYVPAALWAVQHALSWLAANSAIKPNGDGMTLVAHSEGGVVAVDLAESSKADDLPHPQAIVLAAPANLELDTSLATIPSTTLLDCVVGTNDTVVGRSGCDPIWAETSQLTRRDYVWMFSDHHGTPALVANHYVATDDANPTPLDWYSYWKLTDAAVACTNTGTECSYATGGGSTQTSMGRWSDGTPVVALEVTTSPPACPAASTAVGCASTSTALSASATSVAPGKNVTFTAAVTAGFSALTSGTVAFVADGTTLPGCGAVALSSAGKATCTASSSSARKMTVVVGYSGTVADDASTSAALGVTVT